MVGTNENIGLEDYQLWNFMGKNVSEREQETVDGET